MGKKLEIVTLDDIRLFFDDINAATISSKDLVQDTFIFPPGHEDKVQEILEKLRSPTNLLVWGSRGVGKTLFLKKTYYDLLDANNKSVLPLFIDLNQVHHLTESLSTSTTLSDANRLPLQNHLLERYYKMMIYRGVLEFFRNRSMDDKVLDFLQALLGSSINKNKEIRDLKSYLEQEIIALGSPFSSQELINGNLHLSATISFKNALKKFLTNSYSEIFEKIHRVLEVKTFIIFFDEFSMLPAELQDVLMSSVIQSLETRKEYKIYFKIAVMNGRYFIDTQTKDMYQHGFLPLKLEKEYHDIFKCADPDTSIDKYYEAVCLNRLRGMANSFLDENGKIIKHGSQVNRLFSDPEGADCFKFLVNFASYNFRRFFKFILNICNEKPKSHHFTEEMILRQSNSLYAELMSKIKQNPELQQYTPSIDSFLSDLINSLPENTLYFALSDDRPFIIRTLELFSIITQVTDIIKDNRQIPTYLLDLSTYVAIKGLSLEEVREKLAELSIFRIDDIDKIQVFDTSDFEAIQMASKVGEEFQELDHYYRDILELESDLNAGEDEAYVTKSIDRIFKKIEEKYNIKYTRETLEQKIKSYNSRSEILLEADKTLKEEAKNVDQIQEIQLAVITKAASEGYNKQAEFQKLSKLPHMDARLLDELTKIKIGNDFLEVLNSDEGKINALLHLVPMDVRPTLKKVVENLHVSA
jgi:hypothetical protein